MSLTPSAPALRWERSSPDRSLKTPVRAPAYSAVLGGRMFVAFTDPSAATFLVAAASDGTPASIGPVPVATTGLCATTDHLVLAGLRARDRAPVVLELEPSGKVVRELELPVTGALHQNPQPVCARGGTHIVWEESGPAKASTLAWAELGASGLGAARRHPWADRTDSLASSPDQTGVVLLRESGQPPRAALHRVTDQGLAMVVALPAPAVATPVTTTDGTAVLLVPTPPALQLAIVDPNRRLAAPMAAPATPGAISGALLVAAERGVWAIAVASRSVDASGETPGGDVAQHEHFGLVAIDARVNAAGPVLAIPPPVAAAWLEGRLVLWTGRTGATVSTWRLVP